jgi:tetratricopeptide (TPR) repeat protein
VSDSKQTVPEFDPRNPDWRGRLWIRLKTPDGPRVFLNWPRLIKLALALVLAGWLGLAGLVWAFVKFKRGVASVSFVDVAFLPLRYDHYRQALSRDYLALGRKQLEAGTWSKALFSLRQAVAKDPHNAEARLTLAEMYAQAQRPDLSRQILEDGLDDGRGNLDYVQTLFQLLVQQDDLPRLIKLGRSLLPARPDHTPMHRQIAKLVANAEIERRGFTGAKALVTAWFPQNSVDGTILRARIDEATGYADIAAMELESLRAQKPEDEQLCLQLIQLYQRTGQLAEARRVATMRSLQHPDSPGAACDLISLLCESGAKDAAQRELDGYFDRYASDQRALMLIAQMAIRLKNPAVARQVRQHAPHDESGRVPLPFLFAELSAECQAGAYAQALETAVSIGPFDTLPPPAQGRLFLMRCWACYGCGKLADGESWLNQFLTLSYPASNRDALALSAQLRELGQAVPARRILQTLLDRNPDDRPALVALVQIDVARQAWAEVSRRIPQLLALDPAPSSLLQAIWQQGRDSLTLTPDLREQLRNRLH